MRQSAVARELDRDCGERSVEKGFQFVNLQQNERAFFDRNNLRGVYLWFKDQENVRWLGIIHTVGCVNEPSMIRFLDDPDQVNVRLRPKLHSIVLSAKRFPWCLQYRTFGGIVSGVGHHGDLFRESMLDSQIYSAVHVVFVSYSWWL